MAFSYTNPNTTTVTVPVSDENYMFVGCSEQAFDQSKDVRIIQNLRTDATNSGSATLGTIFAPGTKFNEVSVNVTPSDKCVTWCLGKKTTATGSPRQNCVTLSADAALATDKSNNRLCQDSQVTAVIGEPTYRCDAKTPATIIADVQAMVTGSANVTWKTSCTPGKNVIVDSSSGKTLRISVPSSEAPATCTVELTASIAGMSIAAPTKTITLASAQLGNVECATQPPTDLCGIAGGKNACLDCKGIPFGPNVNVDKCGCVDPKDKAALTACYQCTQTNISTEQADVDSHLKSLEKVIGQMISSNAVVLGKDPSTFKASLRNQIHKAQVSGWTVTWTKIESTIYDCPSTNAAMVCVQIPAEEQKKALDTIRCHTDNLFKLGRTVSSDLLRDAAHASSSAARNRALTVARTRTRALKKLYKEQIAALAKLPNTYVTCSHESATVTISAELSCTRL